MDSEWGSHHLHRPSSPQPPDLESQIHIWWKEWYRHTRDWPTDSRGRCQGRPAISSPQHFRVHLYSPEWDSSALLGIQNLSILNPGIMVPQWHPQPKVLIRLWRSVLMGIRSVLSHLWPRVSQPLASSHRQDSGWSQIALLCCLLPIQLPGIFVAIAYISQLLWCFLIALFLP